MLVALLLAATGALASIPTQALAGGGAVTWSQPQNVLSLPAAPYEGSRLWVDGGHQFWAYSDVQQSLWLVTNQAGSWHSYPVSSQQVSNGSDRDVALAVQGGVAYVAWVANSVPEGGSNGNPLYLSYDPSGNPSGPWVQVEVACDTCSTNLTGGNGSLAPGNPSVAIANGNLVVAFYGSAPASDPTYHSYDVYTLTAPLSALPQTSGGSVNWQVNDVTANYSSSSQGYVWPSLASDGSNLDLTFVEDNTTFDFVQGQLGGPNGTTWPAQPQQLKTVSTSIEGDVAQLGAGGGTAAAVFYAPDPTLGFDTFALTNLGGQWINAQLNSDVSSQSEMAAASESNPCGPAVAYNEQPSGGSAGDQPTVATFYAGQWNPQPVGSPTSGGYSNSTDVALAATATGYDLLFQDASGTGLMTATGTCDPIVTSVSPTGGPAAGGTKVTVTGYGFAGATQVDFGGTPATGMAVVSSTEITATAPAGSGTVDVTVTGPVGASPTVPGDRYTYSDAGSGGSGGGNGGPTFADLGGYSYAVQAIEALAAQGVIKGTGPTAFDPGGKITRSQFALLMERTFSLPAPAQPIAFHDVAQSSVAYSAIEAVAPYMDYYQNPGGGYNFQPTQYVDRQDAAAVMVKILAASGKLQILSTSQAQSVLASVKDAANVAPALEADVATAIQAQLIKGYSNGNFYPQVILMRAQVAVLIFRLENQFLTGGSAAP